MFPAPTGQVAGLLGVLEPQLNGLVRRGRVQPRPPVVAGRRLWSWIHVQQAAEALGVSEETVKARIHLAEGHGSD